MNIIKRCVDEDSHNLIGWGTLTSCSRHQFGFQFQLSVLQGALCHNWWIYNCLINHTKVSTERMACKGVGFRILISRTLFVFKFLDVLFWSKISSVKFQSLLTSFSGRLEKAFSNYFNEDIFNLLMNVFGFVFCDISIPLFHVCVDWNLENF